MCHSWKYWKSWKFPRGGMLPTVVDTEGIPIGCTYNSHPMCCAAALANMSELIDNDLINRSRDLGEMLGRQLDELVEKHPCLKERRGLGLVQAVRMQQNYCRSPYLAWIFNHFAKAGYPTNGNDGMIIFAPPFIVKDEEIHEIIHAADEIFTEFESTFGGKTGGQDE